ncbi:MAG: arsenate reductase [Candidatus Binatia bacterium]|nr:arsenate reductase [Candidatus Binatia bacterium]
MRERGVEFDVIEYLKTPLDRAALERMLDMLPTPPADLVRKDKHFEQLGLDASHYVTREAVVDLLLQHPVLMQRPIVVTGRQAIIARPAEKVLEVLA